MDNNELREFLEDYGMMLRICNGAITFCDGDCKNCEDEGEDYEID